MVAQHHRQRGGDRGRHRRLLDRREGGPELFTREKSLFSRRTTCCGAGLQRAGTAARRSSWRASSLSCARSPRSSPASARWIPRFLPFNIFGGIGWVVSMTLLGFTLGKIYPPITSRGQGHHRHHRGVVDAGAMSHLLNRRRRRRQSTTAPCDDGEGEGTGKPAPAGKSRCRKRPRRSRSPKRPRRSRSRRRARPTRRSPRPACLPRGKRFEMLHTFLTKRGANEDSSYYGPRTGWACRYFMREQPLCSIVFQPGTSSASSRSTPPHRHAWRGTSCRTFANAHARSPTGRRRCCGWTVRLDGQRRRRWLQALVKAKVATS